MSYRIRFTLPHGSTGHWAREYATREEAQRAIDDRQKDTGLAYVVEEVSTPEATPEARIQELEAELARIQDAYLASVQNMDVAERNVARLESTLAMVQAAWAVSVANAAVANTLSAEAHCKTVASEVRLDVALAIGDAMHRQHPSEEWAAYKDSLAASRQGPAKASEAPGEGGDSGEGEK